jgi:hypothetical protein
MKLLPRLVALLKVAAVLPDVSKLLLLRPLGLLIQALQQLPVPLRTLPSAIWALRKQLSLQLAKKHAGTSSLIGLGVALLTATSCHDRAPESSVSGHCQNLKLRLARVYPGETVYLFYNKRLVYHYAVPVADSQHGGRLQENLCLDYTPRGYLRLTIHPGWSGARVVDTSCSIVACPTGYMLLVRYPVPKQLASIDDIPAGGYSNAKQYPRPVVVRPDTAQY